MLHCIAGALLPVVANSFYVPVSLLFRVHRFRCKEWRSRQGHTGVLGQVKNAQGIPVVIFDTVKLQLDGAQQVRSRHIQYGTIHIGSGKYTEVRSERTDGNMARLRRISTSDCEATDELSSVVLATQRLRIHRRRLLLPLVRDGVEWVPNVPHVFRQDNTCILYRCTIGEAEGYSSGRCSTGAAAGASGLKARLNWRRTRLTSIEFLQGGSKVYETRW